MDPRKETILPGLDLRLPASSHVSNRVSNRGCVGIMVGALSSIRQSEVIVNRKMVPLGQQLKPQMKQKERETMVFTALTSSHPLATTSQGLKHCHPLPTNDCRVSIFS